MLAHLLCWFFYGPLGNTGKTSWYSKGWSSVSFQPSSESPEHQYFHHRLRLQPLSPSVPCLTHLVFSLLHSHTHGFHPVSLCNIFANTPALYLDFFFAEFRGYWRQILHTCREFSPSKISKFPCSTLNRNFATTISWHAILCFLVSTYFAQP